MATPWATFFPYIQPYLPGCPEMTITLHLQEAAAEFCARSEVWRVDLCSDYLYAGVSDYEVEIPERSVLENVLPLFVDGTRVHPVTDRYTSPTPGRTGKPTCYSVYQDTQIRFYPTPDGSYAFEGAAVIKPSLSATGVEDFIYETHGRAIARGAVGMAAGIPEKQWTNAALATQMNAMFHRAADDAKGRDLHRAGVQLRVAMRKWA